MATQIPHVLLVDDCRVDCVVASFILNRFNIRGIMLLFFRNNYQVVLTCCSSNMFLHIFEKLRVFYNIILAMIPTLIHLQLFAL